MSWYRERFGLFPAILAYARLNSNKGIGFVPLVTQRGRLFLRPGTADQQVYNQIFVKKECDIDINEPRFIVDAGAHIGFSSLFFAKRFPRAIIIAIEPEPSNFDLLCKNVRDHQQIKPLNIALWNRKTHLRIHDPGAGTWGFRVREDASDNDIPAVRLQDIISEYNIERIDILKIDIEGAEIEVLEGYQSWIKLVKALIIELHDRFRPGCTEALEKALVGFDYNKSKSGENIIITNLQKIASQLPSTLQH